MASLWEYRLQVASVDEDGEPTGITREHTGVVHTNSVFNIPDLAMDRFQNDLAEAKEDIGWTVYRICITRLK